MPLYEYECAECGRFEKIRKFSDKPLKVCPTCHGKQLERLLSAPAIQFKGSGWYITDYARKSDGAGDKAEKSDKAEKKSEPAAASSDSSEKSTPKKTTSEKKAASSGTPSKS